jgi:hypothetical protein
MDRRTEVPLRDVRPSLAARHPSLQERHIIMRRARSPVMRACLLLLLVNLCACSRRSAPAPTSPEGTRITGDTGGPESHFGLTVSRPYLEVSDYVDDFPSDIWARRELAIVLMATRA